MTLDITLIAFAVATLIFAGSLYMDRRPREIGQVSLIPFKAITFLALIVMIVLLAHLISLWTGATLPGRRSKF
jgi:hypothetical protein